jgi:hypothetical protein
MVSPLRPLRRAFVTPSWAQALPLLSACREKAAQQKKALSASPFQKDPLTAPLALCVVFPPHSVQLRVQASSVLVPDDLGQAA